MPQTWFAAFIGALIGAMSSIVAALPSILGAIFILLIGWGLGKLVQWVVTKGLRALHFNQLTERAGINDALKRAEIKTGPSAILGIIAYWFVFLIAVNAAVGVLGIPALTALMSAVVLYLPRVFAALLVIVLGAWGASLLGRLTRASASSANVGYADLLGSIVQGFALFFVFAIALDVLGLAFPFLTTAFAVLIGGLVLAIALAFGLGGREYATDIFAGRELKTLFNRGDRLISEDYDGTVEDIRPTFTVLRTARGDLAVQNSELMNQRSLVKPHRGQGGMSEAA